MASSEAKEQVFEVGLALTSPVYGGLTSRRQLDGGNEVRKYRRKRWHCVFSLIFFISLYPTLPPFHSPPKRGITVKSNSAVLNSGTEVPCAVTE